MSIINTSTSARQKVHGVELETSYKPNTVVNITLNYTYLKPNENVQSRMTFNDTSYSYLLRRPTHQLNATLGWNITKAWYTSINGRYVSDRYDVGGYKAPDVKMDGYFLIGGYMEYILPKNIRVFADFQNITNKDFVETVGFNTIPFMVHAGFTLSL